MIQANELRIGNYIQDRLGINHEILDFKEETYRYRLSNGKIMKKHLKNAIGIPLTEEWLLKFGYNLESSSEKTIYIFNEVINGNEKVYSCDHPNMSIRVFKNKDEGFTNIHLELNIINSYVKHVHQLQNLYVALTGEELTIKE